MLLQASNLGKLFPVKKGFFRKTVGHVRAVDGVTFGIKKGETVGLVGESGCGKTTLGRLVLRLLQPTSGELTFNGRDVYKLVGEDLLNFRKSAQIVFQDPYSSLNPRMMIDDVLSEALNAHSITNKSEVNDRIVSMLKNVGLSDEARFKYPHEFSGGQRQRLAIARALILDPQFVVCDEPVSALDVSIQSQILNLLVELKEKKGLTYLFISHDLSVVKYISDRVMVMYLGEIVEQGTSEEVMSNPRHPYTQALLNAVPKVGQQLDDRLLLSGDPPSPVNPPSGCRFHTRCPVVMSHCNQSSPEWSSVSDSHKARCFIVRDSVNKVH